MNWEALGAIGELAGAAGVIITLLYLSRQIRESNRAARQAASREMMEESSGFYRMMSSDVEMARLWIRGTANDETLSKEELLQFRMIMTNVSMIWEKVHHMDKAGDIDSWWVDKIVALRRESVGAPGIQSWYEDRKHILSKEFRDLIEKEIKQAPEYRPGGIKDR